jgi:hypothetical protein
MSAHQYRVTLEYLGGNHAGPELHKPIHFETGHDDDLFETVGKLHRAGLWQQDEAAALAVGMKLFGDVAIANQGDPLFEQIADDLRQFNGKFKESVKQALAQQAKAQGKDGPWEPEID